MIDLALGAKCGSPSNGGWTIPRFSDAERADLESSDAPSAARAIGPMLNEARLKKQRRFGLEVHIMFFSR
jgi:hypothetical protein